MAFPFEEIAAGFSARRALVVGDICLDRWCAYDPHAAEPSRETGIPRTAVIASELTPGAGGTIANNLAALETGHTAVLGVIGEDGHGWELRRALGARGIDHQLCVSHPGVCTFTYTKLLNRETGEEDLPRVDFINSTPLPPEAERELVSRLRSNAEGFDVILVSDQAETSAGGVVTAAVRECLTSLALEFPEKIIWVDSRLRPELFRKVIVKPNRDEAEAACRRAVGRTDFAALRALTESPLLAVTHGEGGVLLVREGAEPAMVPTVPVARPVDICGAGDSFSAGCAIALSITHDPVTAARFGNLVASVTIMKKGTGTASRRELRAQLDRHPLA
ncbi:MAG: Bifunctional protein HldE [Bryobacteraceae bacterium]|nr:Bifunctional protein HldE [Bryobacteraceae bacterium]